MTRAAARAAGALAFLAAATACQSSARYTVPSAAINSAIAVGASLEQRSAGGCYAQCVGGTICNPHTGYCEAQGAVCIGAESDSPACLNRAGAAMGASAPGPAASGGPPLPLGVSPATGTVPPPPGTRP